MLVVQFKSALLTASIQAIEYFHSKVKRCLGLEIKCKEGVIESGSGRSASKICVGVLTYFPALDQTANSEWSSKVTGLKATRV